MTKRGEKKGRARRDTLTRHIVEDPNFIRNDPEFEDFYDYYRGFYLAEKNPLFVWMAWLSARATKCEPPEWVCDYFDLAAVKMLELKIDPLRALEFSTGRPEERPAQHRLTDWNKTFEIGQAVEQRWKDIGKDARKSLTKARGEIAAAFGVDPKTAERHHLRYLDIVRLMTESQRDPAWNIDYDEMYHRYLEPEEMVRRKKEIDERREYRARMGRDLADLASHDNSLSTTTAPVSSQSLEPDIEEST